MDSGTVLITGGAGYIGGHVVAQLRERGREVVVVDDLSSGDADRVAGAPLVTVDIASPGARDELAAAMREHRVSAVIHLAAKKSVEESVRVPELYEAVNVRGTENVVGACEDARVGAVVASSTAAVYGDTPADLVSEDSPTVPLSPYGETKLRAEAVLSQAAERSGIAAASLRYFNVAGAASRLLADTGTDNLIPILYRAASQGERAVVFGGDYPTADGTCVRDFVDVRDVALAHLLVLDELTARRPSRAITLNVGRGTGFSVLEVVRMVEEVTGLPLNPSIAQRRVGDAASVVADVVALRRLTDWLPQRSLRDMVASGWEAFAA